jgi:hypothetical protein
MRMQQPAETGAETTVAPSGVPAAGRHRRVDPQLAVHLVFADLTEVVVDGRSGAGQAIGHLAQLLVER